MDGIRMPVVWLLLCRKEIFRGMEDEELCGQYQTMILNFRDIFLDSNNTARKK